MARKLCPRCKSTDLNYLPWVGQIWECRACGWRGPLVIEEDEEETKK